MVMCTKPDKEWCVAQQMLIEQSLLFYLKIKFFSSIEAAQKKQKELKKNEN